MNLSLYMQFIYIAFQLFANGFFNKYLHILGIFQNLSICFKSFKADKCETI